MWRSASRALRFCVAKSRSAAPSPRTGLGLPTLPSTGSVAHYQAARSCQESFVVNPTLQRFGYSSSAASQPTMAACQKPLLQGSIQKLAVDSPKEANKIPATSYTGISKFPPYYLLFGWIEEIILDYVHHEVTRSMVLVYLRVFLLIVLKDVFLNVYDLLAP